MRRRRCLIPTDGFYEWQPGMPKRPYFVRAKRGADGAAPPLAFAGLWETWTGPNGEEVDTAAIITTAANRTLAAIHGRMPVFVAQEAFDLWLDCANVDAEVAAALIAPAPDALLEVYEVSNAVNRVVNDAAALIAPVSATTAAEPVAPAASPPSAKEKQAKPKKAKASDDQASLF
jgi:putative SOS response-associated peptidase YedK